MFSGTTPIIRNNTSTDLLFASLLNNPQPLFR